MRTSKEKRHLTEKVKQKRIRKWSQPNRGIVDRILRDEIAERYAMKPNKDGALGA